MSRHLAYGRLGLVFGLTLGLAGLFALPYGIGWLAAQPCYQVRFEDIELDPLPPPWIKIGRKGLLERVRTEAKLPELLPILDLDLQALRDDFQRVCPWIRRVRRVVKLGKNRLRVEPEYREPIAYCAWPGRGLLVLDRDAVVLPEDELAREACDFLIEIRDLAPTGATAAQFKGLPGRVLAIAPRSDAEPEPALAQAAARLADFLRSRSLEGNSSNRPPCVVDGIFVSKNGFWARTTEKAMIYWKHPPREEAPAEPSADEKWTMLGRWAEGGNAFKDVAWPCYLRFTRDRAVVEPRRR
jgi:hypothetical protein